MSLTLAPGTTNLAQIVTVIRQLAETTPSTPLLAANNLSDLASLGAARTFLGVRIPLTANTNFYVRPDGNDTHTGLANTTGGAFLTPQGAYDKIANTYDLAGFVATVNIVAGTYTSGLAIFGPAPVGSPSNTLNGIQFVGAGPTTIISTAGICVLATGSGSRVVIGNVKLVSSGNDCIYASGRGFVSIAGDIEFGSANGYHMHANFGEIVKATGVNINISGDAQCHIFEEKGGVIEIGSGTIKTLNAVAFSLATVVAKSGYVVLVQNVTWDVSSGAVTGQRFIALFFGVIDTQSAAGGVNYIPGSIAGNATDGKYN